MASGLLLISILCPGPEVVVFLSETKTERARYLDISEPCCKISAASLKELWMNFVAVILVAVFSPLKVAAIISCIGMSLLSTSNVHVFALPFL